MKVNFICPIRQESGLLRCISAWFTAGRRIATAEGKLVDAEGKLVYAEGKLYAHGTTTCFIFSD